MKFAIVSVISFFLVLIALCIYVKSIASREAMVAALRRENTQLLRDKLALQHRNMILREELEVREEQLRKARVMQSIKDNNTADLIAGLQAEIRYKDRILAQKWHTAKASYVSAQR